MWNTLFTISYGPRANLKNCLGTETTGRRAWHVEEGKITLSLTQTGVSPLHWGGERGDGFGGWEVSQPCISPGTHTEYACLHVVLEDLHSVGPSEGTLSGSPDTLHTPPDDISLKTTLQATCELMGCHIIIIITVIIHSVINYKYYHNIPTSCGLGI